MGFIVYGNMDSPVVPLLLFHPAKTAYVGSYFVTNMHLNSIENVIFSEVVINFQLYTFNAFILNFYFDYPVIFKNFGLCLCMCMYVSFPSIYLCKCIY